jgi:hypothetical protein
VPHQVPRALRQLPADTALFTGRDDELARLLAVVEAVRSAGSPGTVVIATLPRVGPSDAVVLDADHPRMILH